MAVARLHYRFVERREGNLRRAVLTKASAIDNRYETVGGEQHMKIQAATVSVCASHPAGEKKRIDPWTDAA